MAQKKRCFVAINIPKEIKGNIEEKILKKIPSSDCKAVPKENLHVTLAFLGYLEEKEIEAAKEKMAGLEKIPKFEIELDGFGDFNARVFWIGIKKGSAELKEIAEALWRILPVEDKRFSAHITVARNRTMQRRAAKEMLERISKEKFSASFRAETIDFMESILSRNGPEYRKLFSVNLSG